MYKLMWCPFTNVPAHKISATDFNSVFIAALECLVRTQRVNMRFSFICAFYVCFLSVFETNEK